MQSYRAGLSAGADRVLAQRGAHKLRDGGSVASVITDMLFDHARNVACLAPTQTIEETRRRHRARGISDAHYSGFGDGLGAVLTDLLGEQASRPLISAWSDTYWAIVRTVLRNLDGADATRTCNMSKADRAASRTVASPGIETFAFSWSIEPRWTA